MNKKSILIFANAFYNYGKDNFGGGDSRCFNIFNNININFSNIALITNNDGNKIYSKYFKFDYNPIITPKLFDFNILFSYITRTIYSIFKIFQLNKYDIYYSSSDFFPDTAFPYLFKTKEKRWIQLIHHIYLNPSKREGNYISNLIAYLSQKLSFYFIKKKADQIILVNNIVKNELIKRGFNKEKIIVLSNGINIDYLSKKDDYSKRNYQGVFLARLNPVKGIFDLVKIWKIVCQEYPEAKLGIIGEGKEEIKNELLNKIRNEGLENNIDLLGYLNDEAFSIIKNSKVFLFPSHEEGWGIAIAEAIGCRIPVISWDLEVYKEVFEDNIIKIKEGDINLFANQVIELLKNKEKRIHLANKAYNFIQKYSWSNIAKKELEVLIR